MIIVFKLIECSYNTNNTFDVIMNIINEYHWETKIHSFTFDNASINKLVVDKLCLILNHNFGDFFFFHFHFFCHIFNLIVWDELKQINIHIERDKNKLIFITISPYRKQTFKKF